MRTPRSILKRAATAAAWLVLSGLASASPPTAPVASASAPAAKKQAPTIRPIDINTASKKKLMTLPGIGDAEAARIVANRPYRTKADIVFKAGVPEGTYIAIKRRIVVAQPPRPAAGKV